MNCGSIWARREKVCSGAEIRASAAQTVGGEVHTVACLLRERGLDKDYSS